MKTCAFACPSAVHHATHSLPLCIRYPNHGSPDKQLLSRLAKATDTMPSIPLRRSTSLLSICASWRVIDASRTPEPDVSARILWHVVVECVVGARSSRSQFRRLLSSDLFWCRQTQWLAFPGGMGGGSNARRLLDQRLGRKMMMVSRLSRFWSTRGCICVSPQTYLTSAFAPDEL